MSPPFEFQEEGGGGGRSDAPISKELDYIRIHIKHDGWISPICQFLINVHEIVYVIFHSRRPLCKFGEVLVSISNVRPVLDQSIMDEYICDIK